MKKFFLLLFFTASNLLFAQNVVINEIMGSNQTAIYDEDGDAADWIELFNTGSEQVNLSGFGLSDDSTNTKKWLFENAVIEPNSYLLIFASDKDRQAGNLHTNFKISSSGEKIILSDINGDVIDKVNMPQSYIDISYGRITDGGLQWSYQDPSPGSSNTGVLNEDYADSISVSPVGRFYQSPVTVTLSAGDSKIYYTLDGNDPDSTSTEYISPINIAETSVLKAVSYKANLLPGPIIYHTYFINESTDLPVISLSSDPYNLFDNNYGIYANFRMDWERPAHIEFFDDDKNPGFSKDCIIGIYGGQSSEWAQKSFSVKFKDGTDALEYSLFPGFDVTTFKSFILRNSGNDFQYTHIRDAMMQTLVKDLDIDYLEYRPATAFINGEYWGIYNIREKINEHYVANRHGVDPDNIDMLENNMEVIHGDYLHYQQLVDYISTQDMTTDDAYNYIQSMIDLDECILYFAAQAYYDNLDWPGNNLKFWRERSETGKWRWIIYDLDFGFGLYAHNASEDHIQFMFSPVETRYSNPPWATLLPRKLVENPTIKNQFINQIADLLNTNFKSERVVNTINAMAGHIASEITKHRTRWNLNGNYSQDLGKLTTFAQERPASLRNHVRNFFRCGSEGKLTINSNGGGKIQLNSLQLKPEDFPWSGIYFQNNTIHLKAIPEPGYKFDGWSGPITTSDTSLSLNISGTTNITANFSIDTSDVKELVINEINYNSSSAFDSGDWVEIYNTTDQPINISNWYFSDSDDNHKFIFPAETIIGAKAYLVLVENDSAFTNRFPDVANYLSGMDFGFGGGGELLRIFNSTGDIIDSLTYDDKSPWPLEADGGGATLELYNSMIDNSKGENWRASVGNGTPGKINSVVSGIDELEDDFIPEEFVLFQNYPNPFNPTTKISYSIPKQAYITLKVYDVLGREVSTLINEEKPAGNYVIKFDAGGLSSGTYFYRIQAGSFVKTKKLILMK